MRLRPFVQSERNLTLGSVEEQEVAQRGVVHAVDIVRHHVRLRVIIQGGNGLVLAHEQILGLVHQLHTASSVGVAQDLGHDGVVLRVGVVSVVVAVVGHEHIQEGHGVVVVGNPAVAADAVVALGTYG